jgi:membrane protein YqaA with SNARE-associated domain
MAWFDNLLNHFALYPAHLFALLFVMALSKSTVLISSVLPPASVMLLAGITVSQASMHPALAWLAVVMGATAGSVLNYHIGQLMGHTRLVTRFTAKHAAKFLRVQHQLQKTASSPCLRRAFWRCCATSCRWRRDAQAERRQGLRRQPAFRLRMGGAVCRHRHRHQRLLNYKLPIPPSTSSSVPTV